MAMQSLVRMGEWTTDRGLATCLELEGFGLIGAVVDTEGCDIIVRRAIATADLANTLAGVKEWMEDCLIDRQQQGLPSRAQYDAVCAALAKAEHAA